MRHIVAAVLDQKPIESKQSVHNFSIASRLEMEDILSREAFRAPRIHRN